MLPSVPPLSRHADGRPGAGRSLGAGCVRKTRVHSSAQVERPAGTRCLVAGSTGATPPLRVCRWQALRQPSPTSSTCWRRGCSHGGGAGSLAAAGSSVREGSFDKRGRYPMQQSASGGPGANETGQRVPVRAEGGTHGGGIRHAGRRPHDQQGRLGSRLGEAPVPRGAGDAGSAVDGPSAAASGFANREGAAAGAGAGREAGAAAPLADPEAGSVAGPRDGEVLAESARSAERRQDCMNRETVPTGWADAGAGSTDGRREGEALAQGACSAERRQDCMNRETVAPGRADAGAGSADAKFSATTLCKVRAGPAACRHGWLTGGARRGGRIVERRQHPMKRGAVRSGGVEVSLGSVPGFHRGRLSGESLGSRAPTGCHGTWSGAVGMAGIERWYLAARRRLGSAQRGCDPIQRRAVRPAGGGCVLGSIRSNVAGWMRAAPPHPRRFAPRPLPRAGEVKGNPCLQPWSALRPKPSRGRAASSRQIAAHAWVSQARVSASSVGPTSARTRAW